MKVASSGQLKIDVVSYLLMSSGGKDLMKQYGAKYAHYHDRLKIGGYKLILDGSPQGRSAWMSRPYVGGAAGYCGYPWLADHAVDDYLSTAVDEKSRYWLIVMAMRPANSLLLPMQRLLMKTNVRRIFVR